jgi:hypothetical protein
MPTLQNVTPEGSVPATVLGTDYRTVTGGKARRFGICRNSFPSLPPWRPVVSCSGLARALYGESRVGRCNLFGRWNLHSCQLCPRHGYCRKRTEKGRFPAGAQRGKAAARARRKVPVANNLTLIARRTMMIRSAAAIVAPRSVELRMDGRGKARTACDFESGRPPRRESDCASTAGESDIQMFWGGVLLKSFRAWLGR